jgi:hypothetical protein
MARVKKTTVKPPTEIELGIMQEKFLEDPERRIPDDYFLLLKAYARSITLKKIKTKQIYLPPERVDEIATEATILMLSQYKKPEWKVKDSFHGALQWKVIEAMYTDSDDDRAFSLNQVVGESGTQELTDILDRIGASVMWNKNSLDPQEEILKNINVIPSEIDEVIYEAAEVMSYHQIFLFRIYLLLQLRRPKVRFTLPAFKELFLDERTEEAFDLLMLEIRNRISAYSH